MAKADGFYAVRIGNRWFDVAVANAAVVLAAPHDGGDVPWDEMESFSGAWTNASPFPVPSAAPAAEKRAGRDKAKDERDSRVREALELVESIVGGCEDIPERGSDFAASVSEKAADIGRSIEEHGTVTSNQLAALENMMAGVERWINR